MGERQIKQGDVPGVLAFAVITQSLLLAAGIGLWLWSGEALSEFVTFGAFDLLLGLGLTAVLIALQLPALWLWPAGVEITIREATSTFLSCERPYGLGAILIIGFSAGIGEEALFRAGLQTFGAHYLPAWAAIAVSTILFTLGHPGPRLYMASIAVVGLIIGLVYHWSGSLLGVMIAHALYDVYAFLLLQHVLRRRGYWSTEAGGVAQQRVAAEPLEAGSAGPA